MDLTVLQVLNIDRIVDNSVLIYFERPHFEWCGAKFACSNKRRCRPCNRTGRIRARTAYRGVAGLGEHCLCMQRSCKAVRKGTLCGHRKHADRPASDHMLIKAKNVHILCG